MELKMIKISFDELKVIKKGLKRTKMRKGIGRGLLVALWWCGADLKLKN